MFVNPFKSIAQSSAVVTDSSSRPGAPRGYTRVRSDSPHGAAAKRKMTNNNSIGYPDDATNNNCLVWKNVVVPMETDEAEESTNGEPPDVTENDLARASSDDTTSRANRQAWVSRRPMALM